MEQFILPPALKIPFDCSDSESCELIWCLKCCGCKCPNISRMSPRGRWQKGGPRCWAFCVFNCAPWSPFWASPAPMEWAFGGLGWLCPAPTVTGSWQMCSSPGEADPGALSVVWQLPALQIPHGHQEQDEGSQVKAARFWLLAKSRDGSKSCISGINEPSHCGLCSLNSESFPFPLALKEFVSILNFFLVFFSLCTSASALEAGTLYEVKETNWYRVSETEWRRASPLPSPSCLRVKWSVPFPTTPHKQLHSLWAATGRHLSMKEMIDQVLKGRLKCLLASSQIIVCMLWINRCTAILNLPSLCLYTEINVFPQM